MQIISKNNLFILLKKYSGIFFVSDDKEIDPFEVKIVISNLKSTKSFYEEKIPDYIIDSDGKQRKLVWLNEKLYGLNTWAVLWKKNSKIISDNLLELTEEDNDAFILWTELFLSEKPNWVRINAVEGLKKKYGLKDEEALYYHLAEYMHKNSITPRYKYICDMPASFATFQSKKNRMEYSLIQCKLKIHRKLLFRRLTLKTIIHNMFTRKRFVNRLKREGILSKKWSLVNDGKGSSASTLIKVVRDGWTEFIKGNELKQYNSLPNEINAQKKLLEFYRDESWYLGMTSVDKKGGWIGYPFLDYENLSEFFKHKTLSEGQVEKLGCFLYEVVRKLKDISIVHNDLRADNIMIVPKANDEIEFKLIDFGCAYVDGKQPWPNTFWGRYFGKIVCGAYRYSDWIVDDAVSAYLVYLEYGGDADDQYAKGLKDMFGGRHFSIPYKWYGEKR